jgi:hypothetical protein
MSDQPTTATTWKYPHPDDCESGTVPHIRKMVATIQRRHPDQISLAKSETLKNIYDLDAVETAIENLIAAMEDTDRMTDDGNRSAVAAALTIENLARAAFVASQK